MRKLKYAIIGCGVAGKVHGYHFMSDSRIDCVSASDTDYGSAEYFRRHFGFERLYTDYKEMLTNEHIDILSIASPPGVHLEQIKGAADKNIHILCEKPLVISKYEITEVKHLLSRYEGLLGIMLPRRYYNNSLAVKKVLANGMLGTTMDVRFALRCYKDHSFYSTWRGRKDMAGGGVLMSQAIHSIDQLIFLFGQPLAVEGKIRTTRSYIEVEDEAEATIYFKNDLTAKISATANAEDTEWQGITTITGSKGKIVLDSANVLTWDVPLCGHPPEEEREDIPEEYKPVYYGPGHLKVIKDFIAAVYDQKQLLVTALDSLSSVELILSLYDSSITEKKFSFNFK